MFHVTKFYRDDFSRLAAGQGPLECLEFDVHHAVEEVVSLLAERVHAKGLELVCDLHADVPRLVCGDPTRLRHILTHLTGNAVKFTTHGEIVVRVVPCKAHGDTVRLRFEVCDTGIGVAPEAQARLFQAFAPADSSTTPQHVGAGLGLAISKQCVEGMAGEIGVETTPGQGSLFWFTVPFAGATVPLTCTAETALQGLHVLLVDDNTTARTVLQRMLTAWGMRVTGVEDSLQALHRLRVAAAAGTPYFLALLDMDMPGMGGIQLAQVIRANSQLTAVRLVLLTSCKAYDRAAATRVAGVHGSVVKPACRSQLYDCLTTVLGHSDQAIDPRRTDHGKPL